MKEKKTRTKHWLQFKLQLVFFAEAICFVCPHKLTSLLPRLLSHTLRGEILSSWLFSLSFCLETPQYWGLGLGFILVRRRKGDMKEAASDARFIGCICLPYFCLPSISLRNAGKCLQYDSVCLEKGEQGLRRQQLLGPFSGARWSQLALACRSWLPISSLLCIQWYHVGSLQWARMGASTPWKSENATIGASFNRPEAWRVLLNLSPRAFCRVQRNLTKPDILWAQDDNPQWVRKRWILHLCHHQEIAWGQGFISFIISMSNHLKLHPGSANRWLKCCF